MDTIDWTLFAALLGLALLFTGLSIYRAYRRILPYHRGEEGLPANPPDMLINIFMNFVRASYGCIFAGAALFIVANFSGAGLGAAAGLSLDVPISLYWAAALGLLLVVLSYNVLYHNVRVAIESETGADEVSSRMTRVQANFTEYAPTGLGLMIVIEWAGAPDVFVFIGGGLFVLGRILHAWGLSTDPFASFGRVVGIQTTLGSLAFMALSALYFFLAAA